MSAQNTLTKRVADLERSVGAAVMQTICIALVGVDPEKTGPERAIHYPIAGYRTLAGDRTWCLQNGETPEQLQARAIKDAKPAHGAAVLIECFGGET